MSHLSLVASPSFARDLKRSRAVSQKEDVLYVYRRSFFEAINVFYYNIRVYHDHCTLAAVYSMRDIADIYSIQSHVQSPLSSAAWRDRLECQGPVVRERAQMLWVLVEAWNGTFREGMHVYLRRICGASSLGSIAMVLGSGYCMTVPFLSIADDWRLAFVLSMLIISIDRIWEVCCWSWGFIWECFRKMFYQPSSYNSF